MPSIPRIEAELEALAAQETITEADLERFRRLLPEDPETAEVVSKGMPWPWSEVFEYVSASERQSAYWRVRPDRSRPRSQAEADTQQQFAAAAREARGARGTIDRDGHILPLSAALVADRIDGTRFSVTQARAAGQKALRRLRAVVGRDGSKTGGRRPRRPEERL